MSVGAVQNFKHGSPLGSMSIGEALLASAQAQAKTFWHAQLEDQFMEGVDTLKPGSEHPLDWVPRTELTALGYRPVMKDHHWVMTTGVETHVDRDWGHTLVLVLVNDGMYFKQGREKVIHQPGEWYIFNDALPHEVDATKLSPKEAVYLGWAVKLERT